MSRSLPQSGHSPFLCHIYYCDTAVDVSGETRTSSTSCHCCQGIEVEKGRLFLEAPKEIRYPTEFSYCHFLL